MKMFIVFRANYKGSKILFGVFNLKEMDIRIMSFVDAKIKHYQFGILIHQKKNIA